MDVMMLAQRLGKLSIEEGGLFEFAKYEIESLQTELELMCSILWDDDTEDYNYKGKIIEYAFKAEDAIDTYMGIVKERQHRSGKELKEHQAALQVALSDVIKDFCRIKKFMNLLKAKHGGDIRSKPPPDDFSFSSTAGSTSSGGVKRSQSLNFKDSSSNYMVGREDEMGMLLDHLVEGELELTVVSIVGVDGLGSTTLAREAFNSIYIQNYFDCRAWAYLPVAVDTYNNKQLVGVLEALLKCLDPLSVTKKLGMKEEDQVRRELRDYLSNNKYLIVLDGAVGSDFAFWKQLVGKAFPDDHNGSRVLMTVRSSSAVDVEDDSRRLSNGSGVWDLEQSAFREQPSGAFPDDRNGSRVLQLRFLNTEESWKLLYNKVWEDGNYPPDLLEQYGRSIVQKCWGLPLAILFLGGLLSKQNEKLILPSELHRVMDNVQVVDLDPLLNYSYNQLPLNLKLCILYVGVFPEDSEISTRQLFQLWIAEGFIQDEEHYSEATAEKYLEELLERGWIQVVRRRSDGKIKTCMMHSVLRDLSLRVAERDLFNQTWRYWDNYLGQWGCLPYLPTVKSRRLTIHGSVSGFISGLISETERHYALYIRSFMCLASTEAHLGVEYGKQISECFQLLRVLDFGAVVLDEFPDGITSLWHLRYLRLSVPSLKSIPSSLCNLRNLYTLDMPSSRINVTTTTTDVIWKLQSLRHLNFDSIALPENPGHFNSLINLNFLSTFCPSSCNSNVMSRLPKLRTLQICGDLGSHQKALANSLAQLHCLETLKLVRDPNNSSSLPSTFVREFQFPPSLSHLVLRNIELREDSMSTLGNLPKLRVLKLKHINYSGRKLTCLSGGFPCLQVMHLKSMQWLEEWTMEPGAMPLLVCLVITSCAHLRRLPEELWCVKSFCKLELWWPHQELKPKLQEIEEMGRYDIKIYPSAL